MPSDYYTTIDTAIRAPELKIKGSRFIADLFPVRSKEEIEARLAEIRKEFYDATHHCFAYRLGPDGALLRAADDGEPAGTAGKPILLILTTHQITDALLIVTRYYGGTKLGTGGLARAYAEAAQQAVANAKLLRIYFTETLTIETKYEDLQQLERVLTKEHVQVLERTFVENVTLKIAVHRSEVDHLIADLIELFHGKLQITREE